MSYDIYLYRKDGNLEPLKRSEVEEKLNSKISVSEFFPEEGESVRGFNVFADVLGGKKDSGFELAFQDDEKCYWSSCSYAANADLLAFFKKAMKKLAVLLDLKIKDPQISDEVVEATNYDPDSSNSLRVINSVKDNLKSENMSKILGEEVNKIY